MMCIGWVWHLSAGAFRRQGIMFVLIEKHINIHIEILLSACVFMTYWAGLYPEATKKATEAGVNIMLKTTS
jgi:hypothetical protein